MPRQGAIVAVLATAGLASSFMFTLVVPIQSKLPELLDASRDDTAWVVTSTLLAAAVITPIAGRLGDMYGKRRIVLVLLALLVLGSVIAAIAPGIVWIIVGRALQGAVTGVIPLGISILRDVLREDRIDSAIALISATLGVGGALGLPISALITERADWHLLFWVAAALGAIVFVLVLWIVPVSVLRTAGRFDFVGAAGLAVGLIGILLAVSRGNEWGWGSPATLATGLGGILVLLAWGWFELRVDEPLLDLRVAARPAVLLTNIASIAMGFALFSSNVNFPQMLGIPVAAGGFGLSLLAASLVVMPAGLVMMALSPFAGRLARTVGPEAPARRRRLRPHRRVRVHARVVVRGVAHPRGEPHHRGRDRLRLRRDAHAHHALGAADRDGRLERPQCAVPLARHEHGRGRRGRRARDVHGGLRRSAASDALRLPVLVRPGRVCGGHRARRRAVHPTAP